MQEKITSIYKDISFHESRPHVQLMLQTSNTKEIRITFRSGQLMKEHKTPYPIVVHIVEGKIEFGLSGNKLTLKAGDIIGLEPNTSHDLLALEQSIVRLSIHSGDSVDRVSEVANTQ